MEVPLEKRWKPIYGDHIHGALTPGDEKGTRMIAMSMRASARLELRSEYGRAHEFIKRM
jgi:hypothetical protein